jgi:hypothetical protein
MTNLALTIIAAVISVIWSLIVLMANGMTSAPQGRFEGGFSLGFVWIITALLFLAWWFQ